MHVVVAGATGFIGTVLVRELLRAGDRVTVLTRRSEADVRSVVPPEVAVERWSPGDAPAPLPPDTDAVVNLAGASIARRWTKTWKKRIVDSRLDATRAIVDALQTMEAPGGNRVPEWDRAPEWGRAPALGPRVLINASAVGYYGPRGDEHVTEADKPGDDFLSDVCRQWEAAAMEAAPHVRVVLLRTGLVLGQGGALRQMMLPFRLFAGGPLGTGRQWMPWIHIDDCVGLILFALRQDKLAGPINVSAPTPVQNREFARVLGRVMRRPALFPAPAFAVRALLGEMATMILTGQRAVPAAALAAGYEFVFTELEATLSDLLD